MTKDTTEPRWWSHSSRERGNWRWWLHGPMRGDDVASCEVSWRARLTGIWLRRHDSGKVSVSIGLYWLYATAAVWTPWVKPRDRRRLSLTFHDGAMWWCLWRDDDSWSSDVPKWRDGNFNPMNTLFGRQKCSIETLETRDILVPMPEKAYQATARLEEYTWKRARWPFAKTLKRVSIDIPGGIPFAGKGENSWDCGDDATFGITTGECRTIPEGVGILVGSCLRTRVKNGGWSDWEWKREAA